MFGNDAKGRIWKFSKIEDKYADCQFSTSAKNRQSGEWETDFSANIRIIGKDKVDKIRNVVIPKGGIKIQITKCGVTRIYDREKDTNYERFLVFDFLLEDEPQQAVNADDFMIIPEGIEEELPFN